MGEAFGPNAPYIIIPALVVGVLGLLLWLTEPRERADAGEPLAINNARLPVLLLWWAQQEERPAWLQRLVNRYAPVQTAPPNTDLSILSSRLLDEFFGAEAEYPSGAGPHQPEPLSTEPPAEVVRPTRMADDDIIVWLANLRKPGGTAYRFSANKIADLMGGTTAEVLKRVKAAAPGRNAPAPPPEPPIESIDPRTLIVRDNGNPAREIPM